MAAVATVDEDKEKERVMSLPQLQNLMKRDPEAYSVEFDQQWSHFDSQMEIFKLKPQKPSSSFAEQVMFLAHVAPSFPDRAKAFPDLLISALNDHFEVMHSNMRTTLVQALILLRNRNQFPCSKTLPVYFKLFKSQDKGLRKSIFTHIVRDIAHMNQKSKNQKVNFELRDFFFARLKESETEVCRHACAVFITMYRQNVWCDTHVANLMSAGLLHPDLKIAAALAHLFLGNKTKGLEGILDESDDEEEDDNINEAVMGIVGAKKTGNRVKRLKRAKKAAKKAARKNGKKDNTAVSFVAIDLLNDPQTLAEKLLQRLSKGGEPFLFRLLMLHLVARLIGRHQLQVLNLYPFLQKYLVPTQKEVTKVMAALVEASHPAVPPDDVRPVILHIVRYFVTEANSPEIIEVGLNTIREVCARSINILTEDELADLCSFRKHKNKGVSMAVKSLINTYRELHPQLLHRSLRGREATMAVSRGEVQTPQFGELQASEQIEGLDLLAASKKHKVEDGTAADAKDLMTEKVLSPDDFKQLRKLRLQKSIELQMGRKRKAEEMSSSSNSGSDSDADADAEEDERGLTGDQKRVRYCAVKCPVQGTTFACNDGCVISSTFLNDDHCDCAGCEDETNWEWDGGGNPTCNDGCQLGTYDINNGYCDCADCEDEEDWTCELCAGDNFTCDDGCAIDGTKVNNGFCDCGQCEDEVPFEEAFQFCCALVLRGVWLPYSLRRTRQALSCCLDDGYSVGTTTSATALGVTMKIDGIARRVAALPASWIAEQVSDAGQELEISSSPVKDAGFPWHRGTMGSATARNVPLYFFIHRVYCVFVPWSSTVLNMNVVAKEDEANWTCASCGGCPDKCGQGGSAVVCVRCTVEEHNVFITEIADPRNNAGGRFVELYSVNGQSLTGMQLSLSGCLFNGRPPLGAVDEAFSALLYAFVPSSSDVKNTAKLQEGMLSSLRNGNLVYSSSSAVDLGILTSLPSGGFLIICSDKTSFDSLYSPATCHHEASAADSNGGDTIGIIDVSDNIIDIFGIPGELGIGTARDFVGGRVERRAGVNSSRASWRAAHWNIQTDADAPGSFDPHRWVGAPAISTVKVAEELSPFVSLALDAARTVLSLTQVTTARSDTALGAILALTLLTNPYASDSPPSLIQVEAARPDDPPSVYIAFSNAYIQQLPFPGLLVGAIDEREDIATWIPPHAAYHPSSGETISVGTASGRLGHHFLYASLANLESQSFADIVAANATAQTYWRLTQNTSYPARAACVRLGSDSTWKQEAVYRPTVTELQAAGITTDLNGFWCVAARGFGLFGIFIPFASETTTPEPSTTTAASVAQDVQGQVVTLASGLVADTISQALQNPVDPVVVPKPDPPVGTTVDLITLPVPGANSSSFLTLTKPDDGAIPIAIPTALRSSIAAPYAAVLVAQVQVEQSNLVALGLPAALASRPTVTTAEGKQLKLGYKMVEVSFLDLDMGGGAQVLAVPSSSSPIYMRLSDQNFPGAVCAFLNAANEWSEAGTSVPSTTEISEAFGPDIAAAGGFWCAANHLSLFAILEAAGDSTHQNSTATATKVQNKVFEWTEPLSQDAVQMSGSLPYTSAAKTAVVSDDIVAGLITLPFADPMATSEFLLLAAMSDSGLEAAVFNGFRSLLPASYPALAVASFATTLAAQAQFGVNGLSYGTIVETAQGHFKIGPRALQVSLVDMAQVPTITAVDTWSREEPLYFRLADDVFADTAICAWLNHLNEWVQDDTYRPDEDELRVALGTAWSPGFWCATLHFGLFAILEVLVEPGDVAGAMQNLVLTSAAQVFSEAFVAASTQPQQSGAFGWSAGTGLAGALVTIPELPASSDDRFVNVVADIYEEIFIALPAWLSESVGGYDVLSVAEIQYDNMNATSRNSLPSGPLAAKTSITMANGQPALLGPVLVEVSVLSNEPANPRAIALSNLSTPIYIRLSPQEFPGAACAFLRSGSWSQDGTYRPDAAEVAAAFAFGPSGLEASQTGFWCATNHLSLFGILEPIEEAPCDGIMLGSECVAIEILLGAVGGPLVCCSICCIVYCCIKCRRPTAGKVKLTDQRGSSHEFGFQVVKESALSRVVRTPTTKSGKSGRSGQEHAEPEEVEAVKIHVRWDVDVDKAQEANFDFSVAPDGEKKPAGFLAVTDTGVLLAESPKVRPALSEKSNDARSESPRSSRHRQLSEAEERVLADMEDNEPEESSPAPQEFPEVEDPEDILIIANPDDGQDSPKRIKSVSGNWEMFEDGAHVEYWSATHAQWLQGYIDGPGVVTPADPNVPTYNLILKAKRSSKQRREFVELSALRKPLREGQTVSVKLDGEDRWLPAVVIARQSIPLGYRVLLVDGPHDGESVTVLADRVRNRFPAGQRVAVYRGLHEGWRDGVVRGDAADGVPSVTVELDSKMELDGEVVESLQHLVQPVDRTVSSALRHSASSNRVSM
ncbi:SDAD1 [Symbiodinium sp. CCMP2456]|nr:SDAD1 [Symbiodinium sp. CCMP2456]